MDPLHVALQRHATCMFPGQSSYGSGGRSASLLPLRPVCRSFRPATSLHSRSTGVHIGVPVHIPFADITVPTPESAVSSKPTSRVGTAHQPIIFQMRVHGCLCSKASSVDCVQYESFQLHCRRLRQLQRIGSHRGRAGSGARCSSCSLACSS